MSLMLNFIREEETHEFHSIAINCCNQAIVRTITSLKLTLIIEKLMMKQNQPCGKKIRFKIVLLRLSHI